MRPIILTLFLFLPVVAVGQATNEAQAQNKPAAIEWITHKSTEGRFSMLFPGQPTLREQEVDSARGKLVNYVVYASTDKAAFLASYADYPPLTEDPQAVLDRVRGGVVDGMKGTLVKSEAITLQTVPGRQFEISYENRLAHCRIYLAKNRLYQIVAIRLATESKEESTKFLNSFAITPEK
jgi:hypothetical protein